MPQEIRGDFHGAEIIVGQYTTSNPANCGAGSVATATVTVTGVKTGDRVFVSAVALDDTAGQLGMVCRSAKVTANDTITLYLLNTSASAIDLPALAVDLMIFRK